MSEHTPIPWHVAGPRSEGCLDIDDSEGHHLAIVLPDHYYNIYYNPLPMEANARLIAAAPDLLAALEASILKLREAEDVIRGEWGGGPVFAEEITQADAAIAKARQGGTEARV